MGFERLMAEFYRRFAEAAPAHGVLLLRFSSEENRHAEALTQLIAEEAAPLNQPVSDRAEDALVSAREKSWQLVGVANSLRRSGRVERETLCRVVIVSGEGSIEPYRTLYHALSPGGACC